jgi:mono/diheme cytochrome c family protein
MWKHAIAVVLATACHQRAAPHPTPPLASPGRPPSPDQLVRGTYVATIAGCITCHGAIGGTLAGGKQGRFGEGVWRAPNITPDRETGIGAWTDQQLDDAIRLGVDDRGKQMSPIMPYPFYHRMTDEDVAAVIAFLRAQPAVRSVVPPSKNLPVAQIALGRPTGNVDRVNEPLAHGEYLAALMHCAGCHTPMSGATAGVAYAGGNELPSEGTMIVSPNITSDPETGIGTWSEADVATSVRAMKLPDGAAIRRPMAEYAEAWARLTDDDAHALAMYVKSIPAVHHDVRPRPDQPEVTSVP